MAILLPNPCISPDSSGFVSPGWSIGQRLSGLGHDFSPLKYRRLVNLLVTHSESPRYGKAPLSALLVGSRMVNRTVRVILDNLIPRIPLYRLREIRTIRDFDHEER